MADGTLDGLLNISISDSDESAVEDEKRNKRPRDAQNEDEFQAVRRTYSVKIENGEVWRNIKLPLPKDSVLSKPEAQEVLHAVEELYFFRRYDEAAGLIAQILSSVEDAQKQEDGHGDDGERGLDEDTVKTLEAYQDKVAAKRGRKDPK